MLQVTKAPLQAPVRLFLYAIVSLLLTYDGRTNYRGDSLEEEKKSEGIGELVKAEEVHKDNRSEPNICARRDAKNSAIKRLTSKIRAKVAHSHGWKIKMVWFNACDLNT